MRRLPLGSFRVEKMRCTQYTYSVHLYITNSTCATLNGTRSRESNCNNYSRYDIPYILPKIKFKRKPDADLFIFREYSVQIRSHLAANKYKSIRATETNASRHPANSKFVNLLLDIANKIYILLPPLLHLELADLFATFLSEMESEHNLRKSKHKSRTAASLQDITKREGNAIRIGEKRDFE